MGLTSTTTPVLTLTLTSDYIQLEKAHRRSPSGLHFAPGATDPRAVVRATVLAVGPGEQRPDGGVYAMPCKVGDTVMVNAGAGIKWEDGDVEYWVVYGGRKDVIAVVPNGVLNGVLT